MLKLKHTDTESKDEGCERNECDCLRRRDSEDNINCRINALSLPTTPQMINFTGTYKLTSAYSIISVQIFRFLCCDLKCEHIASIPVGKCTMRTPYTLSITINSSGFTSMLSILKSDSLNSIITTQHSSKARFHQSKPSPRHQLTGR